MKPGAGTGNGPGGTGVPGWVPHGCKQPGRGTPGSAAASLRPGPGFRVVTEQPIRGVARARGLFPASRAPGLALAPKPGGITKGSPWSAIPRGGSYPEGPGLKAQGFPVGESYTSRPLVRCFGEHGAFLQTPALKGHRSPRKLCLEPPKKGRRDRGSLFPAPAAQTRPGGRQ